MPYGFGMHISDRTTNLMPVDLRPLTTHPPLEFETARLRLRAVEPTDAELLMNLYANDPNTCRFMSFKCTGRIEDTKEFIESVVRYREGRSASGGYSWVIEQKDTGIPMGSCGFESKNSFTLSGGYILNPNFHGQGYAPEAWKCLVDWAKEQPGVYRIEAHHDIDNPASGKVMEKAGMTFEGILRRHSISPNVSDEPRDAAIYAWARP
jgi:ribosomal-protein-alanine N-acetyltransferase